MRIRSLIVVAAVGLGLVATPAAATTTFPAVLRPVAANQFPEGVAWDPSRQALLVGSLASPARISAVGRDGVVRTVVSDPGVPGFFGLKVDAAHHRIVATYGNPTVSGGGLAMYDLRTGARERLVPLGGSPNDVALAPSGVAYVTDTAGGVVYRVTPDGRVSTVVSDPRLAPAFGANGIVWHPGGYLLVINYTSGRLYRATQGVLTEVWAPTLAGGDGMALRPDGTLVVVTNRLAGVPGSSAAVHELALVGGVAVPLRTMAWPDPEPTTVAVTPYGSYVLDGHIGTFIAGGSSTGFTLRRL
jgi:sugar lactone lactonase YvrE